MSLKVLSIITAIAFAVPACTPVSTPIAEEGTSPTTEVEIEDQTPGAAEVDHATERPDRTPAAQSNEAAVEESVVDDAPEESGPLGSADQMVDDRTAVFDLYHNSFQAAVREQEIDDLYGTFVERNIPLNVVNKAQATMSANTPAGWVGFFRGKDYELVLDEPDVVIAGQGGLAVAPFEEMIDDQLFSTGTDMFLTVKTADGWRLATMNVTLIPVSSADVSVEPVEQDPLDVVSAVQRAISEKNGEMWEAVVFRPQIPIYKIEATPAATSHFTAGDFFAEIEANSGTLAFELTDVQSEVIDDYLAYVTAEYTYSEDKFVIERGTQLWTLIGTPANGWQITAMVWSAN